MSSQAFLRSMFASEEESESESLLESESLDELSFFFFFFFDTFFCFLAFFAFFFLSSSLSESSLSSFLDFFSAFFFLTLSLSESSLSSFLDFFFAFFFFSASLSESSSLSARLLFFFFFFSVSLSESSDSFLFFTFLGLAITLLLLLFLFLFVKAGQQLHSVLGGLVQLLKALLDLVLHPLPLFIELLRNLGRLLLDCHIVRETLAQRRLFARGGTLRPARLGSRPESFQRLQSQPFHLIHGFLFAGLPPLFLFRLRILGLGASPLLHLSNLLLKLFPLALDLQPLLLHQVGDAGLLFLHGGLQLTQGWRRNWFN